MQCQCKVGCKMKPLANEPFCEYHKKHGCPVRSPTTGSEPGLEILDEYNKNPSKRKTHNCFAFAVLMNDLKKISECTAKSCNVGFHSPGRVSGHDKVKGKLAKVCSDLTVRTIGDIPDSTFSSFEEKCPEGHRKIALVTDEKNDFHYYLQLNNGKWVHKPGGRHATTLDSNGSIIMNPELAGRFYPAEDKYDHDLNYNSFCGYLCIPSNKPIVVKGGKRSRKNKIRSKRNRKTRSKN